MKTRQQTKKHARRPIRRRRSIDGYTVFRQRLKDLGFKEYDDYLASDVWKTFKAWYKASKMPQRCLVCKSPHYVLHHWTYMRLGCEDLQDVIPLCEEHHTELHKYMARTGVKIDDLGRQFSELFGFDRSQIRKMLKPFFRGRIKPDVKTYQPLKRPESESSRPKIICPQCERLRRKQDMVSVNVCRFCYQRALASGGKIEMSNRCLKRKRHRLALESKTISGVRLPR